MPVTAAFTSRVAAGDLAPDSAQESAAERLSDLAQRIDSWRPGLRAMLYGRAGPGVEGIYLHGDVGRGKSMLMDLFFETVSADRKRRTHFHAFMLDVHARIAELRRNNVSDPIAKVAQAIAEESWLLCFDELQINDIGDAMILGRLFEGLFGRGVVLVVTSNRAPEELYKDGLNRQLFTPFIDLLNERLSVVELNADRDYRLARLEAAPTWFEPLGAKADTEMDEVWRCMGGGAHEHVETLRVQGRDVEAPRVTAGAARFTFDALCARPLGAADYLTIARRFHTVFLDAIPRLSADKRNEAKRFVTLIDALYETKTKLVASADAEPEALYSEGDGAFEFARTASRLREMRSREYLALGRDA